MSFDLKAFIENSLYYDGAAVKRAELIKERKMSNEITQRIDVLIEEFNRFQEEFRAKAQEEFKKVFEIYWEQNPKVYAVQWTQYTPYFNDGEACEFSVGDMWPMTEDRYNEWKEDGEGYAEEYSFERDYDALKPDGSTYNWDEYPWKLPDDTWSQDEVNLAMSIRNINTEAMEDIFYGMFGDHVSVLATRDGFEVNDYDHD